MKIVLIILVVLSCGASAQEYRCKEGGRIVIGNMPCKTQQVAQPEPVEEVKTAQEIQREFEESVQLERDAKSRDELEVSPVVAPPPQPEVIVRPTDVAQDRAPGMSVFHWSVVMIAAYFIPSVVAVFRRSKHVVGIVAVNLLIGWTFIGWVVALVWSLVSGQEDRPQVRPVTATEVDAPPSEHTIEETKRLKGEVSAAVAPHSTAVELLQALARLDGVTTKAEKSVVIDFLKRQGSGLSDVHRDVFYGYRAREWARQADDDELDVMVASLRDKPLTYRVDLVAAATAIVASGGNPKKREADALERIRALLAV